jgi:hypothetical protein
MPRNAKHPIGKAGGAHGAGPRRLIAGLRITPHDAELLAVVRPLFPEADSEAELAYRLWRRGLESSLAEAAALGMALPRDISADHIAHLIAQRLLLAAPLLRRTGTFALLGLETNPTSAQPVPASPPPAPPEPEAIDGTAAEAVSGLGGGDFL